MATGRAGPENSGPRALRALRALRAETGLMIFHLRVLCAFCAGRWVVTRELCNVVTCKCVVIYGRATTKIFTHAVNELSKSN